MTDRRRKKAQKPTAESPRRSPTQPRSRGKQKEGGDRERFRTPTQLAAILNEGVPRETAAAGVQEEASSPPTPEPVQRRPRLAEIISAGAGEAELLMFRIGDEYFAAELCALDEALEVDSIQPLPGAVQPMLGMVNVRGRMLPMYSPVHALGVAPAGDHPGANGGAALVVRSGDTRVGLAIDDVLDVIHLDVTTLRRPPGADEGERVLVGVARFGSQLVAVIDTDSLVAACLTDRPMETA